MITLVAFVMSPSDYLRMGPNHRQLLDRLLRDVAASAHRYRERELTALAGRRGSRYTGTLLVMGRAVNGWTTAYPPVALQDDVLRSRAVDDAIEPVGACPLSWVSDLWREQRDAEGKRVYNTARSAFWRVARSTLRGLGIESETFEWPTHLAWTNLYKVAPADAGNPTAKLRRAQHAPAAALLEQEVSACAPRNILVLTGADWFAPFAEQLRFSEVPGAAGGYARLAGRVPLPTGTARVVVVPHPQGKSEARLTADALAAFHRIDGTGVKC